MDEKNLNPMDENNTPETKEETPKAEGGLLELFKKKKAMVIVIAALAVAVAIGVSILLVNLLGVDTSVATPDETEPTTQAPTTVAATDPDGMEDTTWPDGTPYEEKQDWDELKKINSDIKGWITVRHTPINYPVLESEEDGVGYQYYLHRYYDKSYDFAGSIFIDYRSDKSVSSRNIITHGHNMNDGSMYGGLLKYGEYEADLDFYKKSPTLFFNTPEGNEQWIIFSVYKTNTLQDHGDFFNYLMGKFDSDAQFMNYVYNVKIRSLIDVPVPVNEDDQIITLSTCSYEYTDFRTVVCARKLRNNEKVTDYINAAKLNENPVWPDVHYYNSDTERPDVTTFKTELQKNNISWYDGKGDLKGNEWLAMTKGNNQYTVTFINYDGSIISTQMVSHGKSAYAPDDPVKPSSGGYEYVFKGWQLDYSSVTCNMTIAPDFEAVYVG